MTEGTATPSAPAPLVSVPFARARPAGSASARRLGLVGAALRGRPRGRGLDEGEAVAPDDDLVAVVQLAPLDAFAVDEHAVEAAVVEDAYAVRRAPDQGRAAGDGGVVEAHVGREAAPDPRPLPLETRHAYDVALAPGEILARPVDQFAGLGQQRLTVLGGGL